MKPRAIHQFHGGSGYGDGITNAMLFIQRLVQSAGYESAIYCVDVDARLRQRLTSYTEFVEKGDEIILLHYSHGHAQHEWIDKISVPKILVYHNITPAHFLPEGSGLRQYAEA